MEFFLTQVVGFLLGLAVNETSTALLKGREKKLLQALQDEERLREAIASHRSLPDELGVVCNKLAQKLWHPRGIPPHEFPLWKLLTEKDFQADLAVWFMAGDIEEGTEIKIRLAERMKQALAGADPRQAATLRQDYFTALDRVIFSTPLLAQWRHQLSLDYLRGQMAVVRRRADEQAGIYTAEKRRAALERYCEQALTAWDIIDLANMPAEDTHIATQRLLLRQLYMPLRIDVEMPEEKANAGELLARLEARRDQRRRREAGHFAPSEEEAAAAGEPFERRVPVGQRLGVSQRLVVLGDPGGGKTTMLRWMATAYLLRHRGDDAFRHLPDTETLPDESWIPVLIRCRDLGPGDLCRSFVDFLTQHLYKTELQHEEAAVMKAVILEWIANGRALLLVDGLDEISDPQVRVMFCQELERTAARYPAAPIMITSRVVGYRDMPYRMGSGFEHGQIAELSAEDKDHFAQRWVEVTERHQLADERARRAQELREALHSSDRIERLTGNPMLLTTLALVKRKVGRLPSKRNKLYAEAVSVLLNWNPLRYEPIDEDEAIPQLGYLAYEMCRQGVQRLPESEVLDLLDRMRVEYPNIRAIKNSNLTPREFLKVLEARSSLLMQSGGIWPKKRKEELTWEFRHLTFQEYLAARALLDGRYSGRDKSVTLAEQVAAIVTSIRRQDSGAGFVFAEDEDMVSESWRETLRLVVSSCKDDDTDDLVRAILYPHLKEQSDTSSRPRVILAALCLVDEPNVSEKAAEDVLSNLAAIVDKRDGVGSIESLCAETAASLVLTPWSSILLKCLVSEYCRRAPNERYAVGGLWGAIEVLRLSTQVEPSVVWSNWMRRLSSDDPIERLSASFSVMECAFLEMTNGLEKSILEVAPLDALIAALLSNCRRGVLDAHASLWALVWLRGGFLHHQALSSEEGVWLPTVRELQQLTDLLRGAPPDEGDLKRYLISIIGGAARPEDGALMASFLLDKDEDVRRGAVLGMLSIRNIAQEKALLSALLGAYSVQGWEPGDPITNRHIDIAAKKLKVPLDEARTLYESIAPHYHLKFA